MHCPLHIFNWLWQSIVKTMKGVVSTVKMEIKRNHVSATSGQTTVLPIGTPGSVSPRPSPWKNSPDETSRAYLFFRGGEGLPPLNSFFLWNPCTQAGCPAELRISWHCWGARSSHSCSYVKYFCPRTNVLEIFLDSIYRLSPGCWLDPSNLWGLANKELVDPVRGQSALLPAQHRHLVFPM